MKIEGNTFHLIKLINTLLPKYIFGEPRNTVMGTFLPIYTTLKCNDEFKEILNLFNVHIVSHINYEINAEITWIIHLKMSLNT